MASDGRDEKWNVLSWAKKVQICQQGISHEDTLLITYVVIFIGLEALFFTAVFSGKLCCWANIFIAVLGVLVAAYFVYIFKRAGDIVDHWGVILRDLWADLYGQRLWPSSLKASEFVDPYKPCSERWKKGQERCGWWKIVFGWWVMSCSDFKRKCREEKRIWWKIKLIFSFVNGYFPALMSRRRMMTTWTPILVIIAWVLVFICRICQYS